MTGDELDALLQRWGRAETGRHEFPQYREERETTGPGSHPISRAREFAPMTRTRASAKLAGRDGGDRRRTMAAAVGIRGLHLIPMAYCDHIRCTETHSGGGGASVDQGVPPELRHVARAMMDLYRIDTFKGLVARHEYTGSGYQSDKADRVSLALGAPVTLRQYRDGLRAARLWMLGRLAA